uniref:Uncharacterized protein n=1 Tax=Glossina palpalis gambiensis TaxID=67801 RepID=A0A1B0AW47_9MUSC
MQYKYGLEIYMSVAKAIVCVFYECVCLPCTEIHQNLCFYKHKPVYAQRENVCENVAALLFLLILEHAYKYNLVFAAYEFLLPIHMQN